MKKRRKKKKDSPWIRPIVYSVLGHLLVILPWVWMGTHPVPGRVDGGAEVVVVSVADGGSGDGTTAPTAHTTQIATPPSHVRPHFAPASNPPASSPGNSTIHSDVSGGTAPSGNEQSAGGGNTGENSGATGGRGDPILAQIRRKIENAKYYPPQARQMHMEGSPQVRFSIDPDGNVRNALIQHSSGSPLLDQAALTTIQHSTPLPYYPGAIQLSIRFELN